MQRVGDDQEREDREHATSHLLEEARMLLPGIQALFGFQLIAVFNQGFQQLPSPERGAHYVAVVLVATCVALVLAPPAYHRQCEPGSVSDGFLRWAGRAIAASMLPLAVALSLDLEVVGFAIVHQRELAAVIACGAFLCCMLLWFVLPAAKRWQLRHVEQRRIRGA